MPSREVVRSLSLPNSGLANIASSEPVPVTSARAAGARSIPASVLTLMASDTSSGARSSSEAPAYAMV